jgi:hypothetical protein
VTAARATSFTDCLRRVCAAGTAMLVFALTVFAASPRAHERLHAGDVDGHTDDGCAVVLFASGVSLPLDAPALRLPTASMQAISPATAAEIFLVSPRYLRQPERGPPSLG